MTDEKLSERINNIENVMCGIATTKHEDGLLHASDLKKELQDAGILKKDADKKEEEDNEDEDEDKDEDEDEDEDKE